jgi:hypothetical protein
MPREPLTLVGTSRTIRSVWCGNWALNVFKPRRGTVRSCTAVSESFDTFNRSAVALAKSQDRRVSSGVFAFGRPDAVRRWSGLGYPAARASQSGERGLSPERGGERESGRRESDGWLHTEVQVASGANCVEARLGSALLRDSPPEVRSKEYVSLWRNAQYRGVDIGKMEISVSLLRKVRGVSV